MNLTFCGQKGGTGKTTLAFLVAETLSRAGKRVAIHDVDPQQSLSRILANLRLEGKTKVETWSPGEGSSYDFTIVDTLPRLGSTELADALGHADRVIMPLQPSMIDVHATVPATALVREAMRPNSQAFVVWNRVKQGMKIASQLEVLAQTVGVQALSNMVPERAVFSYCVFQGFQIIPSSERDLIQRVVIEMVT